MTNDFDSLLKKTKPKEVPDEHRMRFAKEKTMEPEQDQSPVSDIDRKIAELTLIKKQQQEKERITTSTKQFTEPKTEEVTPQQDQHIIDTLYNNRVKKLFLGKRDKKIILAKETEGTKGRQWMIFTLGIIALFFLMSLQYMIHDQWVVIIVLLLGSIMFLPVGMIIGWATLDPYVRCKILRKASHKNYGIINFVGKGQKLISKIKNFDHGLVWKKNETWVITKEHVYQLTKDGDSIVEKAKIDPESIVTLIDTVPVLFVDLDSMQPLSLARDRREGINPLELGSTLKAWVDNQLAKAMFLKKTMDIYLLIIIIVSVASAFLGYLNMTHIEDMNGQLKLMQGQLTDIISRLPTQP
jgi:hypothetical protein